MHIHDDEWIMTASEIDAWLKKARGSRGRLDVLPSDQSYQPADAPLPENIDMPSLPEDDNSDLLSACVCVLASPERVVRLHNNVADSSVSRSILATGDALPGIWVTLNGSAEPFRISMRSDPEVRFLISDMLSAETVTSPTKIGFDLSTEAALVLMAILDQSRRSWLVSLLRHLEPVSIFSLEDIRQHLTDASIEDFRWTLPLVEKLMPLPLNEMAIVADPRPAILELIEAGLIEALNEEATAFDWTAPGRVLAEGDRQAASRLVLAQSYLLPQDDIAHDVMLLTRTPLDIFLILMSGAEASLLTMLPGDLNALLEQVFVAPLIQESKPMEEASSHEPKLDEKADRTSEVPVSTVQPVAPEMSKPALKFCTHCGAKLTEGARFCLKCGTPVR